MSDKRKSFAIYVITKHGLDIAKRIRAVLTDADLFVSPKFIKDAPPDARPLSLPMEPTLRETFQGYDCHIHIISVGAVVRMIAPLLVNKKVDPAIICVDDRALFSICVLSGHVGRGNQYTEELSQILKNTAVITTASDVGGTLTVDILGRSLGWKLADPDRNVTRGCAAVVNETRVVFVQECGEPSFWPLERALPKGVEYATSLGGINASDYEMILIATDQTSRTQADADGIFERSIVYHPKSLVVGIGCDRGTPQDILERGLRKTLANQGLAFQSIKTVASVDAKKDEPGLIELTQKYGWELVTYPAELLDQVEGIENPSMMPKKHVGSRSVSEAASLMGSGATELLVAKQKYRESEGGKNATFAIARIPHLPRQVTPAPVIQEVRA